MIVLDTNVLSEPMQLVPEPAVVAWIDRRAQSDLFTTSTVIAELADGISRLPAGARQQRLAGALDRIVTPEILAGVLAFDLAAAIESGMLMAAAERNGRSISFADAQIAAVCRVHGAALATRNLKDFTGLGIDLVNPWSAEPVGC